MTSWSFLPILSGLRRPPAYASFVSAGVAATSEEKGETSCFKDFFWGFGESWLKVVPVLRFWMLNVGKDIDRDWLIVHVAIVLLVLCLPFQYAGSAQTFGEGFLNLNMM